MEWLILIIVLVVLLKVLNSMLVEKLATRTRSRLEARYQPDELFVSNHDLSFLGFIFDESTLIVGKAGADHHYSFHEVSCAEIVRDGFVVTSADRGSQLLGAAVGGLAFGGVGAIIGGLSGSTRSEQKIRSISLHVIVNDRTCPDHSILFFRSDKRTGANLGSMVLKRELERVNRMYAHLMNAMASGYRQEAPRTSLAEGNSSAEPIAPDAAALARQEGAALGRRVVRSLLGGPAGDR